MATLLENLIARRDAIGAELVAMSPTSGTQPGGRPNAPGQLDHVGYKDGLYRELAQINEQIAIQQGPVEIVTYGIV